jgi:hypothetical protein
MNFTSKKRTSRRYRAGLLLLLGTLTLLPLAARADTLPSRDPHVVVPLLQAFHEHGSFARLKQILGAPDREELSGFSITVFRLTDGSSVYVKATPRHNRIYDISSRAPGVLAWTLYSPMVPDLDHPIPASAPY